ncbi:exopolysaccharide biosynthesis polyprenyl glycosylphosphotransferase [Roseococcus sp. DSY-14]|uniref:exopolysaccharide biosynthesis polyprenyl glycosylphosphotransferase n=1 Tax=Roseococcus sp. DSY-14 TaxID=3369650 RepID=UPI00387B8770
MTNLFGHSVRSEFLLLSLAEALACFGAFYLILQIGVPGDSTQGQGVLLVVAGLLALCTSFASGATGLYQQKNWLSAGRLLAGSLLGGLLLVVAAHLVVPQVLPGFGGAWLSRLELVAAFVAAVIFTRIAFLTAVQTGALRRRIALPPGPGTESLRAALQADALYDVVDLPAHPAPGGLAAWIAGHRPGAVVLDDPAQLPEADRRVLEGAGVRLWRAADFAESRLGQVDLERLPADWLQDRAGRRDILQAVVRRAVDISLSCLLLLVTLPVILVTALAVKLDSPGPVFYRQQRVGLNGRVFTLFKFRSMTADAEKGQAVWASKNDPRVTRVGKFIRLTRIDEIPQVFNVLRGDMAFVGPRPERPEFVARLTAIIPHYAARAVVPPGITGWAQVNYPYGASDEDSRMKLTYDLYYVRRRSLFLDLLILIATVRVVLFQEGSR